MRSWMWAVLLGVGALVGTTEQAEAVERPGKYFENERWGYKVRAPKGWTAAAMSADEAWIASKHIGDKLLTSKKAKFPISIRPDMWVIGFPHVRQLNRGAKREENDGVTKITVNNPYKDYKDFLKRESWFVGGGYYFSQEEEAEHEGMKVTMYEVKIEKMVNAPMRMVTWVYHFEDADFAIQFKIVEDHVKSYEKTMRSCLKSFRRVKTDQTMPDTATTGNTVVDVVNEDDLTPEEKEKRRREKVERTIRKEVDALPKGWHSQRSEHYVALSHVDRKFTKKTLDFAEGIRGYLDKTFPGIGSDYVPPGIIRIFESSAEEQAFYSGTRSIWGRVEQVLVTKKHGSAGKWEYEYLSGRLTSQWLSFKNQNLAQHTPWWLQTGLNQHMKFAKVKGKRVEFKPDEWDRESLKGVIKKDEAVPLKDMFSGDTSRFTQHGHIMQAGSVVGWMLGKGNRGKLKNAVREYLAALLVGIEDAEEEYERSMENQRKKIEAAAKERASRAPDEDEDEDEDDPDELDGEKQWEEIRKALEKRSKSIKEHAFNAVFDEFTDKDWARLDKAWKNYAK